MGTGAYGHLYSLMLYYGRVALLERCALQPKSKTEAVTLTPEIGADRPSHRFHRPALDPFECTADLDNGLDTRSPPHEPRSALSSQPAPLR